MAGEIQQVFVDAFRDNVRHLAQQKTSKLRQYTDQWSPEAETGAWDRLSKGEMGAKTRKQATPETGRLWTRRIAIAAPWSDGEIIECEDPSMMLQDPSSNLVMSMGYATGRKIDDIIIGAAIGNATDITRDPLNPNHDGTHTPTAVALPAGQVVGGGGNAMSFDLVTQVQETFMNNDIDPDVPKIFVVAPAQVRALMNLTEQTSNDYVQAQALQQYGIVPNWLGFTWIVSTRVTGVSGTTRDCFAMTHDAVGLHIPQDVTSFVQRDPTVSYAWRPYCQMTLGAVRIEDEKVVKCTVDDTTTP